MRRLYRSGALGAFEYGEGEYLHNCEPAWHSITYGDPAHWRNNMSVFFYCTHSIGPLIHISGLKPVKVTGFEMPFNNRMARMGAKAGWGSVIMITLENGAVLKCLQGVGPSKNSVWFSVYGSLGTAESRRETRRILRSRLIRRRECRAQTRLHAQRPLVRPRGKGRSRRRGLLHHAPLYR